jgi:hypothetical protein
MTRDHRRAHVWLWLAVSLSVGLAFAVWLIARRGGAS